MKSNRKRDVDIWRLGFSCRCVGMFSSLWTRVVHVCTFYSDPDFHILLFYNTDNNLEVTISYNFLFSCFTVFSWYSYLYIHGHKPFLCDGPGCGLYVSLCLSLCFNACFKIDAIYHCSGIERRSWQTVLLVEECWLMACGQTTFAPLGWERCGWSNVGAVHHTRSAFSAVHPKDLCISKAMFMNINVFPLL